MSNAEFMRQVDLRTAEMMRYYDLTAQAKQNAEQATGEQKARRIAVWKQYQLRLAAAKARLDQFIEAHG